MNQLEINKNSYNNIVNEWSSYRNKTINTCIKEFSELLPKNSSILDIGCGTGQPIAEYLSNQGFKVTGIDISEKMIEEANKLNLVNATFIEKDILEFESEVKFDGIIAFDSTFHIEESKQKEVIKVISNLLKEDGYFIFTHGLEKGTVKGTMFDNEFIYSALSKEELLNTLKENDLEIIRWEEHYQEPTTGDRNLLVIAKKTRIN